MSDTDNESLGNWRKERTTEAALQVTVESIEERAEEVLKK